MIGAPQQRTITVEGSGMTRFTMAIATTTTNLMTMPMRMPMALPPTRPLAVT